MRGFRIFLPAVALSAVLSQPLAAAEGEKAMTFTGWSDRSGVRWGSGQLDYIFGDGEIVADSPARLQEAMDKFKAHRGTIVVLNSPGGDVDAGLKMGRMIRKAEMNTTVGTFNPTYIGLSPNLDPKLIPFLHLPNVPPFPGYCYSSCTLMLLGGVERTVRPASDYGVHRFYYEKAPTDVVDESQKATAQLVDYLDEMGISPAFVAEMVKKGRDDVTHLTQAQLAELRVITPSWTTTWKYNVFSGFQGRFYLRGDTKDQWGEHQYSVYCPFDARSRTSGAFALLDALLVPGGRVDAGEFVKNIKGYILELDQGSIPVDGNAVFVPAFVSAQSHRIAVSFKLSRDLIAAIENSRHLGVAFLSDVGDVNVLQFVGTIEPQILREYSEQCEPSKQ